MTDLQTRLAALIAAIGADIKKVDVKSTRTIRFYGDSYAITPPQIATVGKDYPSQVCASLGATRDTYAQGGRRSVEIAYWMINGQRAPIGSTVNVRGSLATWPGVSSAECFTVIDTIGNDQGHYPAVNVTAVPTAITGAGGVSYLEGICSALATMLILTATETRVEVDITSTFTGTWTDSGPGPYSGDNLKYSSTPGDSVTVTVTPPETGPYAGEVYYLSGTVDPTVDLPADYTYSIDGGSESVVQTPPGWEKFTGHAGTDVAYSPFVKKIVLPNDGSTHTIKITHAGPSGAYLFADCFLIPSSDPWPVFVMGTPRQLKTGTGLDSTQLGVSNRNWRIVTDAEKAVVASFPHAVWVPSSMSTNGIGSDGIHPNDRGMEQRTNDLLAAFRANAGLLAGLESKFAPDSDYAVV